MFDRIQNGFGLRYQAGARFNRRCSSSVMTLNAEISRGRSFQRRVAVLTSEKHERQLASNDLVDIWLNKQILIAQLLGKPLLISRSISLGSSPGPPSARGNGRFNYDFIPS